MKAKFACKNIELSEIIRCSFGLTKTEYTLLIFLIKNNQDYTIKEISDKLNFERSTIQKALKSLTEKKLTIRKQENLNSGGYRFYYGSSPKKQIKEQIFCAVDQWHDSVKTLINSW